MSQSDQNPDTDPTRLDDRTDQELTAALNDPAVERLMEQASAAPPEPPRPADGEAGDGAAEDAHFSYDLKRGRVSAVRDGDVLVDLTGFDSKLQGVVPLKQFDRPPRVGSVMDFVVERADENEGVIHLSREGAVSKATWQQLQQGAVVEARVVGTNKGGLDLEMAGGISAFMPSSQIDLHRVEELEPLVGQKLRAMVERIERRSRKVVISRRRLLQHEQQVNRQKLLDELEVGQTRQCTVKNVVDFGAFVDLGGLDGMVHISDMSYGRINTPSEAVKVGQQVTVMVLKIDKENCRIRLGLKQVEPDPWDAIDQRLRAGDRANGRVVRVAEFGAFIELEPGVEGLVHISELSDRRVNNVEEVIQAGQTHEFRVLGVNIEQRRIKLSMKDETHGAAPHADRGSAPAAVPPEKQAAKSRRAGKALKGGLDRRGGMGQGLRELKL